MLRFTQKHYTGGVIAQQQIFLANPLGQCSFFRKYNKRCLGLNLPERCNLHPLRLYNFITRSIISVHFASTAVLQLPFLLLFSHKIKRMQCILHVQRWKLLVDNFGGILSHEELYICSIFHIKFALIRCQCRPKRFIEN